MLIILFHGFYTNLQNRIGVYLWKQIKYKPLSAAQCAAIKGILLHKSLKSIRPKTFMTYVSDLQKCPWEYNKREDKLLKKAFRNCCNASHSMIINQQNAPLGQQLQYETNPKMVTVNEKIYNLLPETSPFTNKLFDTCAVVGNGGILQHSYCGSEIDKNEYVFRLNLPPMTLAEDIGTRSDLVTANPSIPLRRYQKLQESRKPFAEHLKNYGSAIFLLPAFAYVSSTDVCFRVLYTVRDFNLPNQVVFFHPEYLKNLSIYWGNKGIRAKRLSSGIMVVSAAIELCKKVTLYGFWPFPQDLDGNTIPHHYYDDKEPSPGFHSMPDEFYFYTQMHIKGTIQLKVGQCS
ncbi:alpha-2,8-sialyltransferase 8F-like [Hyla sarda]|uniref:alpha-2,8-sialyltransferase 8F-like n=1 Tax=Hyla sarda TaxID=327740 RepID=UPI0024C26721|nr:alpha-2,8-sialyltransferase 8F-like [Hyla sarda]